MYSAIEFDASTTGLVFAYVLYAVIAFAVSTMRIRPSIKWLIWAGLALRIVGALGRESIKADAARYYRFGALHAQRFLELDFSPFWDQTQWWGENWIGTNFVTYPAGIVVYFLGQNLFAVFLVFALIGFAGLAAFGKAFQNSLPNASPFGYWAWLCLFPSLWFWPSSLGKEALMMCGLGFAALAYLRYDGQTRWLGLAIGLGLVFCIRPQVVAVFLVAMILSTFLEFDRWTPVRLLQAVVLLAAGTALMWFTLQFAVESEGADGVNDYIAKNAEQSTQGGSGVGAASLSPVGVLTSILNVLFRPFIWEAHNISSLVSAVEVFAMWTIIFLRRRQLGVVARVWREYRALRFAIAFTFMYVIALGFSLGNLGIIARQRVLVFPFFFLIVEAGTMLTVSYARRQERRVPIIRDGGYRAPSLPLRQKPAPSPR